MLVVWWLCVCVCVGLCGVCSPTPPKPSGLSQPNLARLCFERKHCFYFYLKIGLS